MWEIGLVSKRALKEFVSLKGKKEAEKHLTVLFFTKSGRAVFAYKRGIETARFLEGLKFRPLGTFFIVSDDDRFDFTPLKRKVKHLGVEKFLEKYGDVPVLIRAYNGVVYNLREYAEKLKQKRRRK